MEYTNAVVDISGEVSVYIKCCYSFLGDILPYDLTIKGDLQSYYLDDFHTLAIL